MEQVILPKRKEGLHPATVWRLVGLGLLTGFTIGYWLSLSWQVLLAGILVVGVLSYKQVGSRGVNFFVIGCLIALLRGNGLMPPPPAPYLLGEREFSAQVVELPKLGDKVTRYVVAVADNKIETKVLITASPWPQFNYGDRLKIICEVKPVEFRTYTNRGIWRECAWPPKIELVHTGKPGLRQWLYELRRLAGQKVKSLVAEPYATLTTGMLWGDDSGLTPSLVEDFRRTGTSHLLAVSGFNVMVLTKVLFWFCLWLGLWRRPASLVVLVLTVLFVIFSGAEPSVVRAGVMGSVLLIGQLLTRKPDELNLLVGTGAVMLLISPWLIADLGWQLSFMAMVGLAYLSPPLSMKLTWLPSWLGIRQAGAETLAATITTTPVILIRLGKLSLVTPLANLMVAPVVTLVYWFGLGIILLSLPGQFVAMPVVWLLSAVLFYMTSVITLLATLPWATVSSSMVAWLGVVIFYGFIVWWLWRRGRGDKKEPVDI